MPTAKILYVDGDREIVNDLKIRFRQNSDVLAVQIDLNETDDLATELNGWARMFVQHTGFRRPHLTGSKLH